MRGGEGEAEQVARLAADETAERDGSEYAEVLPTPGRGTDLERPFLDVGDFGGHGNSV